MTEINHKVEVETKSLQCIDSSLFRPECYRMFIKLILYFISTFFISGAIRIFTKYFPHPSYKQGHCLVSGKQKASWEMSSFELKEYYL